VQDVIPARGKIARTSEEDLTADSDRWSKHPLRQPYEDVLAIALPKTASEEKKDEAVRENIIEHAGV